MHSFKFFFCRNLQPDKQGLFFQRKEHPEDHFRIKAGRAKGFSVLMQSNEGGTWGHSRTLPGYNMVRSLFGHRSDIIR